MAFVLKTVIVVALTYLAAVAFMFFFQRKFMYRPQRQIYTPYKDLAPENLHPVSVKTADGLTLTCWYAEPRKKPTEHTCRRSSIFTATRASSPTPPIK